MWNGTFDHKALFFLAGATLAGGTTLLLAPQTGRRTRRMLRRKAEDTIEYFTDTGHEIALRYRGLKKGAGEAYCRGRQAIAH